MLFLPPKPHQPEVIEFGLKNRYSIIGDEMGLGKSYEAIAIAQTLELDYTIVCPAMLKYNWYHEIQQFAGIRASFQNLPEASNIISYSSLAKHGRLFTRDRVIICDEAHYVKNLDAQRTKTLHKYIKNNPPAYLILLTGTPVTKGVEDFYSLLKLMDYCPYGTNGKKITAKFSNRRSFARHFSNRTIKKFTVKGRTITKEHFSGVRNEKELRSFMQDKYIRRTANEVLDLPPITYTHITYKESSNLDKEMYSDWKKSQEKNQKMTPTSKRKSAEAKAPLTAKYALDVLKETGSLIIFSDHINSVATIVETLEKEKISCAKIVGGMDMGIRDQIVQKFQKGEIRVIVASIKAANVGITLTRANHMIFNDLSWNPSDNMQAEKRFHRISQKNKCFVHIMSYSPVDKLINSNIVGKMEVINTIV